MKPPDKMTADELRRVCAEADGWTWQNATDSGDGYRVSPMHDAYRDAPPNYPNDPAACLRLFEKECPEGVVEFSSRTACAWVTTPGEAHATLHAHQIPNGNERLCRAMMEAIAIAAERKDHAAT